MCLDTLHKGDNDNDDDDDTTTTTTTNNNNNNVTCLKYLGRTPIN
jgi:hypothetical protein